MKPEKRRPPEAASKFFHQRNTSEKDCGGRALENNIAVANVNLP
jgi:hypothetical protein